MSKNNIDEKVERINLLRKKFRENPSEYTAAELYLKIENLLDRPLIRFTFQEVKDYEDELKRLGNYCDLEKKVKKINLLREKFIENISEERATKLYLKIKKLFDGTVPLVRLSFEDRSNYREELKMLEDYCRGDLEKIEVTNYYRIKLASELSIS